MKEVLKACNCLPWYMDFNSEIPVCNLFQHKCFEQQMLKANDDLDFLSDSPSCNCFPNCYSLYYNPQLVSGINKIKPLKNRFLLDLYQPEDNSYDWYNETWVRYNWKDTFFLNYIKDDLKGIFSFLS